MAFQYSNPARLGGNINLTAPPHSCASALFSKQAGSLSAKRRKLSAVHGRAGAIERHLGGPCLAFGRSRTPFSRLWSASSTALTSEAAATVLIVGASRGLGLELVGVLASSPNYTVHGAATRSPSAPAVLPDNATFHELDATDPSAVADLIRLVEPTIIISCVSSFAAMDSMDMETSEDGNKAASISATGSTGVDFTANKNLIDAACAMGGVSRFFLISALGAGDSEDSVPSQVKDNLRPVLLEKSRAEKALRNAKPPLQYTILRPGPLTSEQDSGRVGAGFVDVDDAVVTESKTGYGPLDRRALAVLIQKVLESKKETVGKTFTAVDPKRVLLTSPYVRPLEFWEPLPFVPFELE